MRVASQIFAFVLVMMSLATPCLAEISDHRRDLKAVSDQTRMCGGPASKCDAGPLKAVLTRTATVSKDIVISQAGGIVAEKPAILPAGRFTDAALQNAGVKPACTTGVNLFLLCRQLN
jgi:hypothetical protein